MKKLNLLKGIVDFVWIMSLISIPFLIVFLAYVLIKNEPLGMPIKINGTELNVIDLNSKIILFFLMVPSALLLYSLFLFRKILRFFQKRIIFDLSVINELKNIGIMLIITSLCSGIPSFFIKIMNHKVELELGLNPFIMIFCLGLFFMVLSEVFGIAKQQKEENELTI